MKANKSLVYILFVIINIAGIAGVHAQTNDFPATGNASLYSSNYIVSGQRLFFQSPIHLSNSYSRGLVSAGIYWNKFTTLWEGNGESVSDFSMLRFENNGIIGLFNRSTTGVSGSLTDAQLESYRRLTILTNGNVGIGIKAPAEKLSVNGKIRAQEIKVEMSNWPDYVFAKNYKLPSLQQTEKHIKEKGHLPGMPSAADVKANGVNLGDINAKLLQKIEELTLLLIDQNKRIEKLESK